MLLILYGYSILLFYYEQYRNTLFLNRSEIDVDLRTLVYYYGISNTGEEEWNWLYEKFLNTTEASEKSKLMYALAASRETWILNT